MVASSLVALGIDSVAKYKNFQHATVRACNTESACSSQSVHSPELFLESSRAQVRDLPDTSVT